MHRKFFMGVDEAGYGPNLGPLVVAASLWSAPGDFDEQQFADALVPVFACRSYAFGCSHVPLGDSKQLYATQSGLGSLEAGLLALLPLLRAGPYTFHPGANLGTLLERLTSQACQQELNSLTWYSDFHVRGIPGELLDANESKRLSAMAHSALQAAQIELVNLRAEVVCERQFNQQVLATGSKGDVLCRVTLELVASLLEQCTSATDIYCDRQGGRKNYLPQLLSAMPNEWFQKTCQSSARSSYRTHGARPLHIHFSVGGDSFPPTALASMLAKYLRQRLMEVLNSFWCQHLPDLKPTAGYPQDARRFRSLIEPIALRLQCPLDHWWRIK